MPRRSYGSDGNQVVTNRKGIALGFFVFMTMFVVAAAIGNFILFNEYVSAPTVSPGSAAYSTETG